jgi:hypothetical protein
MHADAQKQTNEKRLDGRATSGHYILLYCDMSNAFMHQTKAILLSFDPSPHGPSYFMLLQTAENCRIALRQVLSWDTNCQRDMTVVVGLLSRPVDDSAAAIERAREDATRLHVRVHTASRRRQSTVTRTSRSGSSHTTASYTTPSGPSHCRPGCATRPCFAAGRAAVHDRRDQPGPACTCPLARADAKK